MIPHVMIFIADGFKKWCERRDSNSHGLPHWNLNPARLPVPPHSHIAARQSVKGIDIDDSCQEKGLLNAITK
jgi:hypothetical protein